MDQILTTQSKDRSQTLYNAFAVLGGSLLLGLFAKVQIPLPFTPIPLAFQSFIVLLLGAFLGPKKGSLAVLLFIAQGLGGMPVFAAGKLGLAHLAGPAGGYVVGYVVAAFLTGSLVGCSARRNFLALTVGSLAIYLLGAAHLAQFIGMKRAVFAGMVPFVPGDFIKILVATSLLSRFR